MYGTIKKMETLSAKPVSIASSNTTSNPSAINNISMSTPWLHGDLTPADAELTLQNANAGDGDFLVTLRGIDEYIMFLIYKGKPTRHLFKKENGVFIVNNLTLGTASTIQQAIDIMYKPLKGWPVLLQRGITRIPSSGGAAPTPVPSSTPAFVSQLFPAAQPVVSNIPSSHLPTSNLPTSNLPTSNLPTSNLPNSQLPTSHLPTSNLPTSNLPTSHLPTATTHYPPWLHVGIQSAAAEILLKNALSSDGDFLVALRDGVEYVLYVMYKGEPTKHKFRTENGFLLVNKLALGASTTIEEAIDVLSEPLAGWPIALQKGLAYVPKQEPLVQVSTPAPENPVPNAVNTTGKTRPVVPPLTLESVTQPVVKPVLILLRRVRIIDMTSVIFP